MRWYRLVAVVGLMFGLLLVAHGMNGPRQNIAETARPYQPPVSRGASENTQRPPVAAAEKTVAKPQAAETVAAATAAAEIPLTSPGSGESIRMLATAYTLACGNGDGVTATGTTPRPGIIAVDPRVIPHDTLVYIDDYGYFRAEDTGGAIKGDRIDVFMHSRSDALSFGKRWVDVKIIGKFEEPGLVKYFPQP